MRIILAFAAAIMLQTSAMGGFEVVSYSPSSPALSTYNPITNTSIAIDDPGLEDFVHEGTGWLSETVTFDVNGSATSIDPGTWFSSYMFNLHLVPTASPAMAYTLVLEFDSPVLGVQFSRDNNNSKLDKTTGWMSTADPNNDFTPIGDVAGKSFNTPTDSITIVGQSLIINVEGTLAAGYDGFRVLQAVPESTTILSWAALAGFGCVVYRRYQK